MDAPAPEALARHGSRPPTEAVRRLPVLAPQPAVHDQRDRWLVVGLSALAAALYAASFFLPWWEFTLFAPQYPRGLHLVISLTGLRGDVQEINLLNHYIGMAHLEDAAQLERKLAGWGVAAVAFSSIAFALAAGRRPSWLMLVPGILFPLGFIADNLYWLNHFGNNLDPKAPLRIPPFTPSLFGEGIIGQFRTEALPMAGFWLVLLGLGAICAAFVIRRRVCARCVDRESCGGVCSGLMVLRGKA